MCDLDVISCKSWDIFSTMKLIDTIFHMILRSSSSLPLAFYASD